MSVFTHTVVGTNDLEKSRSFYDKVLGALGLKRLFDGDTRSAWGADQPALLVTYPINGQPATSANGGTIGFAAPSRKAVDSFHAHALANGGICEGPPGLRDFVPNAYGAYIRDPDGNKFCAFCYAAE
ncbi:VOC family protein [Sphingomonas sp. SRS2]|uniref:VOC family protein n=1 Tax=Sphingomonas sp. SRS2 TaxID=133190 RepID=UPI0006184BC6|nr:VOC family protein [Sphingomonas sp. SRS2]KKC25189.1 glyoxalase [Sphingomonas sp. SRS2]